MFAANGRLVKGPRKVSAIIELEYGPEAAGAASATQWVLTVAGRRIVLAADEKTLTAVAMLTPPPSGTVSTQQMARLHQLEKNWSMPRVTTTSSGAPAVRAVHKLDMLGAASFVHLLSEIAAAATEAQKVLTPD